MLTHGLEFSNICMKCEAEKTVVIFLEYECDSAGMPMLVIRKCCLAIKR
jgi:hypothetical protein